MAALLLFHLAGCLWFFPPSEIFSGEPLLTSDYVAHFLDAARNRQHIREGSFWDYSTAWAAGAPSSFIELVNGKAFLIAVAVAPAGFEPLAFNLTVLALLWLPPLLLFLAARQFGLSRRESLAAAALFMIAWYGSSLFRVFWRGGSILFPVGVLLAMLLVGRLHAMWTEASDRRGWLGVALGASLLLWVHPAAAVVAIVGGTSVWAVTVRERGLRLGPLAGISAIALVTNLPWLWPFLRNAGLRRSFDYDQMQGTPALMVYDFLLAPLHLAPWHKGETAVLGPLAVCFVAGLAVLGRGNLRAVLLGQGAGFLALAYGTSWIDPISVLQPYRFVIPLAAVLSIGAAPLLRAYGRDRIPRAATLALLVASLLFADRLRIASHGGDYLGTGLGEADRFALGALREHAADASGAIAGRVLLEGDWLSEPVAGRPSAKRVSYTFVGLERYLDAEWIGASVMSVGLWQEHASFWQGVVFGRPLEQYDEAEFLRRLEIYDVTWIATIRSESREWLERSSSRISRIATRDPVAIFRVDRVADRVWSGRGAAAGEEDHIRFESADGSPAVLKYHWIPGLRADPPAPIRPSKVDPDSPCDFIEIDPPEAGSYEIRLDG